MRTFITMMFLSFTATLFASTTIQMATALSALTDLIPFITEKEAFESKTNQKYITERMGQLKQSFMAAGHEKLMKQDVFAPSYLLAKENVQEAYQAFVKGNKDYSFWRLKELTALCLDCHTRLPTSHPSSFNAGTMTLNKAKFKDQYHLGIAQLIVRQYIEAKTTFTGIIDQRIIKGASNDLEIPLKQVLLIQTKILKRPKEMSVFIAHYLPKKEVPLSLKETLKSWEKQLLVWEERKIPIDGFKTDNEVKNFIASVVEPHLNQSSFSDGFDVDHLLISGLLSNYLYEYPQRPLAPELNYWIGRSEKYLKRENFFGSGDLFFKQCIQRYPTHPVAVKCLAEYKEDVEFEYSGSSGTHIPKEIQFEIKRLESLINKKGSIESKN